MCLFRLGNLIVVSKGEPGELAKRICPWGTQPESGGDGVLVDVLVASIVKIGSAGSIVTSRESPMTGFMFS